MLLFCIGIKNAENHLLLLGISGIKKYIDIIIIMIIIIYIFLNFGRICIKRQSNYLRPKVWMPLIFIIITKYIFMLILEKDVIFSLSSRQYLKQHINLLGTMLLNFGLIFIITEMVNSLDKFKKSTICFALGMSISSIIGVIIFPEKIGYRTLIVSDIYFPGSFWNGSVIATISIFWLLIYYCNIVDSRLKKIIGYFLAFISLIGGFAGLSRGLLFSMLVSFLFYLFKSEDIKSKIKIISLTVAFILLFMVLFPEVLHKFNSRIDILNIKEESRINIWLDYIYNIKKYFLFGSGIEGNKVYSKSGNGAHSMFLNWFSNFGIFGLIFFVRYIFRLLKVSLEIYNIDNRYGTPIVSGVIAYIILGTLNETGFREIPFFVFMSLVFSLNNILFNENYMIKEQTCQKQKS